MERDNKKLRAELRDFQERSDRKGRPLQASEVELRALQQELSDKTKVSIQMRCFNTWLAIEIIVPNFRKLAKLNPLMPN